MSLLKQDMAVELNHTGGDASVENYPGPLYNNTLFSPDVQSNWTRLDEVAPVGIVRDIGLGAVLAFLCMLTFVGNAMVLHAVRTERRLQTVSKHV